MKVVSTESFDGLQQALTAELIRAIKGELEKVEAPDDLVEQLTGSIAFAVTSVLDDVAGFEASGRSVSHIPHMLRRNNSQLPGRWATGQGVGGCTASMRRSVFSSQSRSIFLT